MLRRLDRQESVYPQDQHLVGQHRHAGLLTGMLNDVMERAGGESRGNHAMGLDRPRECLSPAHGHRARPRLHLGNEG